ncbi:MAG: acyl-CoA dehydratase activase [Agathobaculum sp.]|jgi:predicted CoA-substrate-specific enzyme activase|uniref:acyl-CoA dehydratase activase n=1 Tax=Agathobaculum sp. TaxID=2048138 RepID=UPI003D9043CC
MFAVGIDIGSTASKAVVLAEDGAVAAKAIVPIGTGTVGPARVFSQVLEKAGITREDVGWITATGYGRFSFEGINDQKSELSCHAKGISHLLPGTRTIVDIGGQDIKVMRINDKGLLMNFVMNDKCAAGTGRFLDTMAKVLDVDVTNLSELSFRADEAAEISSTCTVFAESEVISKLAANVKLENIVAGIHKSVARRVASLVQRVGVQLQVAMSGGVALNQGLVHSLEEEIDCQIQVHEDCQLAGALGAALYAYGSMQSA